MEVVRAKVVLLGEPGVGKTSLRRRWMGESLTNIYQPTTGADFCVKRVEMDVDGVRYSVQFLVWDIGGQEEFSRIRHLYYSGAMGALIVYDVTRPETFYALPRWIEEFIRYTGGFRPFVLVGNKIDLREKRQGGCVTTEQGRQYAEILSRHFKFPILFIETSALTGENVDLAFRYLGREVVRYLIWLKRAKRVTRL